jgi:hypothetical protein
MVIRKGITNTVALTLSEEATISPRAYVFTFIRDLTFEQVNAVLVPTVTNVRSEVFEIEEGVDITLDEGWWTFRVYEAPIESPQSDEPSDYSPALTMIEIGKCVVIGATDALPAFQSNETTKPVFK